MNLFVILRREGFSDPADLEAAAARSSRQGEEMANDIRWIRSYVLNENGGKLGTVCVYEASDEDSIRKHATAAGLPISEIVPIADTVVVRADPR